MGKKEELREKIQRLKGEYTSGSITKEEYAKRVLEIKRDIELLKRENNERPQKGFNKRLLVIPLLIVLIVPVSYFLLKEAPTGNTNKDIYTLKNEEESWPTLQGDPQRTGAVHGEIPDNVEVKWKFDAVGSGGLSIACAYRRVYFGDYFGYFYCLDGDTGELIWKFHPDESIDFSTTINSTPTIYDKKVYFHNRKGGVYCLSAMDGSKIWEYDVQRTPLWSMTAVVDEKFYMICDGWAGNERLICLDANTGELIWDYRDETELHPWIITVGDNKIFLNPKNYITCLDKNSGELVWKKKFGEFTNTIVYSEDKIYFWSGSFEGRGGWYCVNADNGEIVWEKDYGSAWDREFSIFNGKLYTTTYISEEEIYFYSLDAETGEILWKKELDHCLSAPIVNGNKIVSLMGRDILACFSTENGEELWRYKGAPLDFLGYMDKKIYYWGNYLVDDRYGYVYCIGER